MVPIATLETLAFLLLFKVCSIKCICQCWGWGGVVYSLLLLERTPRGLYFAFVWEILAAYTVVPPYVLKYVQRSPVDA